MKLKTHIAKDVSGSNRIKGLICAATDRSMQAVDLWLKTGSDKLCHQKVLEIISSELKMKQADLVERGSDPGDEQEQATEAQEEAEIEAEIEADATVEAESEAEIATATEQPVSVPIVVPIRRP